MPLMFARTSACQQCHKVFKRQSKMGPTALYCSKLCRHRANFDSRPKFDKTCIRCGANFKSAQPKAQYCSHTCAVRGRYEQHGRGLKGTHKKCVICGKEFEPRYKKAKCCSLACGKQLQKLHAETVVQQYFACIRCGALFKNQRNVNCFNKYCSRECYQDSSQKSGPPFSRLQVTDCVECGKRFIHRPNVKTCSHECKRSQEAKRPVVIPQRTPCCSCKSQMVRGINAICKVCRITGAYGTQRKRAKRLGVVYTDVTKTMVLKTYGTRCWLCKKAINLSLSSPDGRSFSFDHVVPVSLGGWHDLSNLRPAHLACNMKRSNHYEGQLMLRYS